MRYIEKKLNLLPIMIKAWSLISVIGNMGIIMIEKSEWLDEVLLEKH